MRLPKVLVVGDMSKGSNSLSLAEGFLAHTEQLDFVDTSPITSARIGSPAWLHRKAYSEILPRLHSKIIDQYIRAIGLINPDLILCIKTIDFNQSQLLDEGKALKCHLSFDDVSNPENISDEYLEYETAWDLVFTTKRHNISELRARGVRSPQFIYGAYDPKIHFSQKHYLGRKYSAGFIGAARSDRITLPQVLAKSFPKQSVVCGPRWRRTYPMGIPDLDLFNARYGEAYKLLASEIQAGVLLLNSANRDTHTNRTFEIPAAGQLIIGPSTEEHLELFEDGKEAIFLDRFSVKDIPKMLDVIGDTKLMAKIAGAGQRRLLEGHHTYEDRALEILTWAGLR